MEGGANTGTHPSFPSREWQFVCLEWEDNAEFLHSLLPYNNATYILKYCQYNKQSAKPWMQSERTSASPPAAKSRSKSYSKLIWNSLAEAEMQWKHLTLVQMAHTFGWKSPWFTKLVCRKHEGIPLHYKKITKHEKARTGVIVHLRSLRRGEQYCYINLVKKRSVDVQKNFWDTLVHHV